MCFFNAGQFNSKQKYHHSTAPNPGPQWLAALADATLRSGIMVATSIISSVHTGKMMGKHALTMVNDG